MKYTRDNLNKLDWKPVKINIGLVDFIKKNKLAGKILVIDSYLDQLEELFLLRNPKYRFKTGHKEAFNKFLLNHKGKKNLVDKGNWFYFPWLNSVIHFLEDTHHQELRTGRNRNLINNEEQKKFYNSTVGILGMSVGSHIALTLVMTGGAKSLRIADPDVISGSNLNRIRTGFGDINVPKTIAVARKIYEINPYSIVEIFTEGLTHANIQNFLFGINKKKKLDLVIEEMDNPYFKILIREEAKKLRIPVLMGADNADGIVVDVERFDLKKNLPLLHGILGKVSSKKFKDITPNDLPKILAKMAGAEKSTVRMLESVKEVGKTLYSWPQLGNAATLCGAVLTYLARQIILGKKIPSGRTDVNISNFFLATSKKEKIKIKSLLSDLGVQ